MIARPMAQENREIDPERSGPISNRNKSGRRTDGGKRCDGGGSHSQNRAQPIGGRLIHKS